MGEIPRTEDRRSPIRRLGRSVEPIHTVAYYSPEIYGFNDDGFKGWWHAYFAYRSAPMGAVSAAVVTAVFYNFAPRMVARAVPGCWDIMSPDAVRARQTELTAASMQRALGDYPDPDDIGAAASALRSFASGLPAAARPLYGAWAAAPWPSRDAGSDDSMDLWHGCTLLREFRFDCHNIALAAGDLDPVECHVMMSTGGHGNGATIQKIRGWTAEEWESACLRLIDRGWVSADGGQTAEGTAARRAIERHTDELSSPAADALAGDEFEALLDRLERIVSYLVANGTVAGVWPPPHVVVDA
ncbi:SCO6745 family protein [Candidatus Poriferisodalis sp.]|uniref:SCO6745 family protein n=1 Tax=Candidatus Poriferisodalis sp. TaxID=3101277 RepID=UPI003B029F33